jgi:broad specificity phosphatase PhoE
MVPRLFFVRHGEAAHNPLLGTAAWIEREKPAKHLRSAHRLFFANFSLIRHANTFLPPVKGNYKSKDPSEMNAALLREARSIVNPTLTPKGRAQAEELGKSLANAEPFDLCVTTPLARAIETAHLAFGAVAKKFLVSPMLCETATGPTGLKLAGPQRGHSVDEMKANHPYIASWDLSLMTDDNWILGEAIEPTEDVGGKIGPAWHNPVPVEDRLAPLAKFLKSRPEARVVVVGHSGVFDKLLGRDMGNCELVEDDLSKWQ